MCRLAWLLDHYFSSLTTAALSYDSYVQSQIRDPWRMNEFLLISPFDWCCLWLFNLCCRPGGEKNQTNAKRTSNETCHQENLKWNMPEENPEGSWCLPFSMCTYMRFIFTKKLKARLKNRTRYSKTMTMSINEKPRRSPEYPPISAIMLKLNSLTNILLIPIFGFYIWVSF